MSKKTILTKEQIQETINLYKKENIGLSKIGKLFNITRPTIKRILEENNISISNPGQKWKGGKKEADKRYYKKHKTKIKIIYKKWAKNNKDNLHNYHKKWRDDNRENLREQARNNHKNRLKKDPIYKLNQNIRTALWTNLKENEVKKYKSTFKILPFTLNELKIHLESLFTKNMNWSNYGEWHIDHIIPLSYFKYTSINSINFLKCWSLKNLRPMWKTNRVIDGVFYEGNLNKNNKINSVNYQHIINEQKKIKEKNNINFNINKINLKDTEIRTIERKQAEKIINEYEWLGYLPLYTKYHFGIFFKINNEEKLGGVVCYQPEYSNNTDVWDKYEYKNKIITLSRGCCLWWAPKNTASYFITQTLKWLKQNTVYKIITATVDPEAGEIGKIYQSLNWYYVGLMPGNIKNGKELKRTIYIIDKKIYNSRHMRKKIGTAKKEEIKKHFPNVIIVQQHRKRRYFWFIGNKKEKEHYKNKIEYLIKSYPKTIEDIYKIN